MSRPIRVCPSANPMKNQTVIGVAMLLVPMVSAQTNIVPDDQTMVLENHSGVDLVKRKEERKK